MNEKTIDIERIEKESVALGNKIEQSIDRAFNILNKWRLYV